MQLQVFFGEFYIVLNNIAIGKLYVVGITYNVLV